MTMTELEILKRLETKPMDAKLYALERMAMRFPFISKLIDDELVSDCVIVLNSLHSTRYQKKACRIILNLKYGVQKTNDLIEKNAVVTDRNDSLVRRWRKSVVERDKVCKHCGNTNYLEVHHISHWSEDPVNRINVDNGVLLCNKCHAKEHPELSSVLFERGGSYE